MIACPDCGQEFPEPMLLRHREFEHAEQLEAEGSARAAREAAADEDDRYTPDGFLRRTGPKPDAPPTDPASLLGGLFPSADPGASLPPWDQELQDRERP